MHRRVVVNIENVVVGELWIQRLHLVPIRHDSNCVRRVVEECVPADLIIARRIDHQWPVFKRGVPIVFGEYAVSDIQVFSRQSQGGLQGSGKQALFNMEL